MYCIFLQVYWIVRISFNYSVWLFFDSDRFPFYKANDERWKNSVRHNLSINPHFRKGARASQGAGHLWSLAANAIDLLPLRNAPTQENKVAPSIDMTKIVSFPKVLKTFFLYALFSRSVYSLTVEPPYLMAIHNLVEVGRMAINKNITAKLCHVQNCFEN